MAQDHWPWDVLIPAAALGLGWGASWFREWRTRRHEDRRRFARDAAKEAAVFLNQAVLARGAAYDERKLRARHDGLVARASEAAAMDPTAPVLESMLREEEEMNAELAELTDQARTFDTRSREALSVLMCVAASTVVKAAVVLLNNLNSESPVWAETVNAYAVAVRHSIGIEGNLDAFKVLAKP